MPAKQRITEVSNRDTLSAPSFLENGNAFFCNGGTVYTDEKIVVLPVVKVKNKPLDHHHMWPRLKAICERQSCVLQKQKSLKVIGTESHPLLKTQNHDPYEMLQAARGELTYR